MEGKEMLKTFKRLAATFLIAVFMIGTLSVTNAEAALPKPGNARFVGWDNNYSMFTSCVVRWNQVAGATQYQIRLCWTDGSHQYTDTVGRDANGYHFYKLANNHVYKFDVRAIRGSTISPWSNPVFVTPWPKNCSFSLVSSRDTRMKLNWTKIYGCNGYNVWLTTNPYGKWYWNLSTKTKCWYNSATVKYYRGSKLKTYTNYYVRIVSRRIRKGVFCTVPAPYYYYCQTGFRITKR